MRLHFQERLQSLRSQIVAMGIAANEMVRDAAESVVISDPSLANEVIRRDDDLDRLERELMQEAAMILMQEAPVASDLKFLVSTLGIVSEIEKVADHAVKLARRGTKVGGQFPQSLKIPLRELSEVARLQFASALKLYAEYNPELASAIVIDDDEVDSRYTRARDTVLTLVQEDSSNAKSMVRTIEIFHALEHVADHAVAIAKRMQLINEGASYSSEPEASNEDFK